MRLFSKIFIATAFLAAAAYMPASAKNYMVPKAYMFGFVASFNDSIVYFTDISQALGQTNRTVVIISATKRKDVEKKLIKMKKLYTGKNTGKYDVRYISTPDFKFRPVNMDDSNSK